ncbi:hypothetical protein [Mycobacterium leprae]|uniref:hypothetical protein n=1 Tax=Mycobacterium leprae TaxID=1769 RepID=UPI001E2B820F|nr:hypothetical protein [Mycobacterium leprae]
MVRGGAPALGVAGSFEVVLAVLAHPVDDEKVELKLARKHFGSARRGESGVGRATGAGQVARWAAGRAA